VKLSLFDIKFLGDKATVVDLGKLLEKSKISINTLDQFFAVPRGELKVFWRIFSKM